MIIKLEISHGDAVDAATTIRDGSESTVQIRTQLSFPTREPFHHVVSGLGTHHKRNRNTFKAYHLTIAVNSELAMIDVWTH